MAKSYLSFYLMDFGLESENGSISISLFAESFSLLCVCVYVLPPSTGHLNTHTYIHTHTHTCTLVHTEQSPLQDNFGIRNCIFQSFKCITHSNKDHLVIKTFPTFQLDSVHLPQPRHLTRTKSNFYKATKPNKNKQIRNTPPVTKVTFRFFGQSFMLSF